MPHPVTLVTCCPLVIAHHRHHPWVVVIVIILFVIGDAGPFEPLTLYIVSKTDEEIFENTYLGSSLLVSGGGGGPFVRLSAGGLTCM